MELVVVQQPKNVLLNYIFVVEIQSKLISRPFIGYCEALAWWPKLMLMWVSVSGPPRGPRDPTHDSQHPANSAESGKSERRKANRVFWGFPPPPVD